MSSDDEIINDDDLKSKKNSDNDENDDEEGGDEYEVEMVLDMRTKRGKREFKVHWKGYGSDEDSWEPEENLGGAMDAVQRFLAKKGESASGKPGKGRSGKKRGSNSTSTTSARKKRASPSAKKPEPDSDDEKGEGSDEDEDGYEPTSAKKKKTTTSDRSKGGKAKTSGRKFSPSSSGYKIKHQDPLVSKEENKGRNKASETSNTLIRLDHSFKASFNIKEKFSFKQKKAVNNRMSFRGGGGIPTWLDTDEESSDNDVSRNSNNKEKRENESEGKERPPENDGAEKRDKSENDVESPVVPVDPSMTNNTTIGEQLYSDHDPLGKGRKISGQSNRSKSNVSTGTVAGKVNSEERNSRTATPAENNSIAEGTGSTVPEWKLENVTKRGRIRAARENEKDSHNKNSSSTTAAANQQENTLVSVDVIWRSDSQFVFHANYGGKNARQCTVPISAATEKKIFDLLKVEFNKHVNNNAEAGNRDG